LPAPDAADSRRQSPPGANRKRGIVHRGLGAETGTVRPSTTSIYCSKPRSRGSSLTPGFLQLCDSRCCGAGDRPHILPVTNTSLDIVIKAVDEGRALATHPDRAGKLAWLAKMLSRLTRPSIPPRSCTTPSSAPIAKSAPARSCMEVAMDDYSYVVQRRPDHLYDHRKILLDRGRMTRINPGGRYRRSGPKKIRSSGMTR